MKAKEEYLEEDGLVGDPNGIDRKSEGYKKLKQAVAQKYNSYSNTEKLHMELQAVRFAILDYLDNESVNIIPPGVFIKKCLEVSMVNQKTFAQYINWNTGNLTKLLNGGRKINADIAIILEATFLVSAATWMQLEDKNELILTKQQQKRDYHQYSLTKLQQATKTA